MEANMKLTTQLFPDNIFFRHFPDF